jgi:predicted Rdx family selenoprotein
VATSKGPAVSVKKTPAGDYELGATIDGVFVAFARKDGGYIDAKVAKAKASDTSTADEPEVEE